MTRRLRATVGLACLGLACLGLVGCGGGPDAAPTAGAISLEQLTGAAGTSAKATSGRLAFSVEMSLPGGNDSFALSGEGAFDAAADRSTMSVDLSSFAKLLGGLFGALAGPDAPDFGDPDAWTIDVVQAGEDAYVRLPAMSAELPEGKSWVRGDDGVAGAGGVGVDGLDRFTQADPRELLGLLRAASGDVEVVGGEELRGTQTTHYRATIDPAAYAKLAPGHERVDALVDELVEHSGIRDVPVDVWLDATGMIRKVTLAFAATPPAGTGTAESSLSFELWDYGEPVAIEPPPASEVVDASALKR